MIYRKTKDKEIHKGVLYEVEIDDNRAIVSKFLPKGDCIDLLDGVSLVYGQDILELEKAYSGDITVTDFVNQSFYIGDTRL